MVIIQASKWQRYLIGRDIMHQKVIPVFDDLGLKHESALLRECGQYISVIRCKACHLDHFAGYSRCKSRWCIPCSHVKVLAWIARLLPVMTNWLAEGNKISMLNFTIKDVGNLTHGIEILNKSFRGMYNTPQRRKYWQERFPGGIRSLEVKRGKNSGLWHPHLHCMVLQPPEYKKDFDWLVSQWEKVTQTHYKKIIGEDVKKAGSVWIKNVTGENLLQSVCETLKYILKPEDSLYSDKDNLWEAWNSLKGKRQVNTWGLLRGLSKKVDEDIDRKEEKMLTEFICQHCGCTDGELKSMLFSSINDSTVFFDVKQ